MAIGISYELEVHFAGMCLLVTDGTSAKVMLPNPVQVQAASHDPVLIIRDHEGLVGTPDQSLTLPGSSTEYGLWSLKGRSIRFESEFDQTGLDVELSAVPEGWVPPIPDNDNAWSSVLALANVGEMADTQSVRQNLSPASTGPVVPIPFGRVRALPPHEEHRRAARLSYKLKLNGPPAVPMRAMADRIAWTLPPTKGITRIVLTGRDPVTIEVDGTIESPLMVSNVAAGACRDTGANHFDVYFEMVDAKRRAFLSVEVPGAADEPHYPEICRSAVVRVKA